MRENRKFTRAKLPQDIAEWKRLLGAQAHWPSHEQVDVYDLAYKGAAIGAPSVYEVELDDKLPLKFSLSPYGDIEVLCRVVWVAEDRVGLEFQNMNVGSKQRLDQYLDGKLIGQNLRPVDARYFHGDADFTDWYSGPHDTHVFLWRNNSAQIEKAMLEAEFGSIEFDGKNWNTTDKDLLIRFSDILSQIPNAEQPLIELANTLPRNL